MSQSKPNLAVKGAWEVKRRFRLPAMSHPLDAEVVEDLIQGLSGVVGTDTDVPRHRLTVVYDITRLDYRHLLDTLATSGFPAEDSWWGRLKASWLQSLDETGRENASAPEAPCCSHPKGIASTKKH